MRVIRNSLLLVVALLMGCTTLSGSRYSYLEQTDTYRVEATANIQSNSETVDLQIVVVQDGEIVKHIQFGKNGTDNTAALEVQKAAIDGTVNLGREAVRGLNPFPYLP